MALGVERMNKLLYAAVQGVPVDEVARNDEERAFYERSLRWKQIANRHGLGLTGVNE